MKNIWKIITFTIIIGIGFFSCKDKENQLITIPYEENITQEEIKIIENNNVTWVPGFTSNGINYPIFINKENAAIINQIIEDEVAKLNNSYEITPESEIAFTITYEDDNYISILGLGYIANEGYAYAATIYWPVMIDIKNGKKLVLNDIVNIDEKFMVLFIQVLEYYFNEIEINLYEIYSKEEIKGKVLRADIENYSDVRSYFTKEKICIAFSIPRVLGEFIDVELLFNDVTKKINIK